MAETAVRTKEHGEKPAAPNLLEGGQLVDHRDGRDIVLKLRGVRTQFGDNIIHDNLDFDVFRGEIVGLVGGSGTGKSVLLRTIIGLNRHTKGTIEMLGVDTATLHGQAERKMQARTGVQFQDGALFSSLSVTENIIVPVREHVGLDEQTMRDIAALKVAMVGLPLDAGDKKPSELSGGMRKRASLARALALDPDLLFLDEPTAGFDPQARREFHQLIRRLSELERTTILLTTHDLDEAERLADRVLVLAGGRIVADDSTEGLARRVAGEATVRWTQGGERHTASTSDPTAFVRDLFARHGEDVADLEIRRASLEDAYLVLVQQHEAGAVQDAARLFSEAAG
jgi:ABC-type transporter Mla maintaining outer membrane lipid asymmetry ATPase subunit MlaF